MVIREKCSTCQGDGWVEGFEQVDEYEWEPRQEVCLTCNGSGYIEVEVGKKTASK